MIKVDHDAAARTMAISLNLCHALSIALFPVIPETCNRIYAMLGFDGHIEDRIVHGKSLFTEILQPALKEGHKIRKNAEILFTKIEEGDVAPELAKIAALLAEAEKREAGVVQSRMEFKPAISFDDFLKVDLRVAKVLSAEPVKKAAKLLKLQLQVGSVTKQVLAGIAKHYTPEEMIGKNVVIVANLAERSIRDEVSEGMILAVEGDDGKLFVIEPSGDKINGKLIQ
jgi:methionyl-tRNA synthetase